MFVPRLRVHGSSAARCRLCAGLPPQPRGAEECFEALLARRVVESAPPKARSHPPPRPGTRVERGRGLEVDAARHEVDRLAAAWANPSTQRYLVLQPRILVRLTAEQGSDQRLCWVQNRLPGRRQRCHAGCGAARGMSSFHEPFHDGGSEVVHSGYTKRYAQVKRGAPGRIRTCAPASGDR